MEDNPVPAVTGNVVVGPRLIKQGSSPKPPVIVWQVGLFEVVPWYW